MEGFQRLDKLLGNSGYGSRKDIKTMVRQGRVIVDGIITLDSGMQVNPEVSTICINGEQVKYREFVYIMMNKPAGVISATFDKRHKTVVDLLPEEFGMFEVFPVGRLDLDTEGLVLLTNNGQLAHDILSPKKHIAKTYYARVKGRVGLEDVDRFRSGITLEDGYRCLPAELEIISQSEISEINLTIYEGKFHQVKRMFQAVGKEVIYLKRLAMGPLNLDKTLELGEFRELTDKELKTLEEFIIQNKIK